MSTQVQRRKKWRHTSHKFLSRCTEELFSPDRISIKELKLLNARHSRMHVQLG